MLDSLIAHDTACYTLLVRRISEIL